MAENKKKKAIIGKARTKKNANLFKRYIWLVDLIYRSGKITFNEINSRWESNPMSEGKSLALKTFHNHREAIRELFEIDIECQKSFNEYYILNADDIKNGGIRTWLLNTFAVNNLINESHQMKQRIQFENIPSGQQFLTPIIEAIRDELTMTMSYRSYHTNEAVEFEIKPYFVKVFKQRWYLIAMSDKLRIYGLDRVLSIQPTKNKFKFPVDFDPEAYFADCYGIIKGVDAAAQIIRLRVASYQANYVRALPLHSTQKEMKENDQYSIFEYFIKPTFDFMQEILSMGDDVEVISPKTLREEMAKMTSAMSEKYLIG